MSEVTRVLTAISQGDAQASAELLPLVYEELRRLAQARMAREPAGHTLQPTALVHEAYLRLLGDQEVRWDGRGHFFADVLGTSPRTVNRDWTFARAFLMRELGDS